MMKFSLPLALLAAFLFASCSEEPTIPTTQHHRTATYGSAETQEYPPPQQPFNPNGPVQPTGTPPPQQHVPSSPPAATAGRKLPSACSCAAADKSRKGRLSVRDPCSR